VTSGARVVAVKLHPKGAALLRQRFDLDPVKAVMADAAELWLSRHPFRVVAKLPVCHHCGTVGPVGVTR